jgi:Na+/proline symporter
VVWTDVLQAITLAAAVLLILGFAVAGIEGGWRGLWEIGGEHGRWTLFHFEPGLLARKNFTAPNSVYTALAFALFMRNRSPVRYGAYLPIVRPR